MKFLIFLLLIVGTNCTSMLQSLLKYRDFIDANDFPRLESPPLDKANCKCRLGSANRIVGGETKSPHYIPWMVSISDIENTHFCGGSIINSKLILTSADCLQGFTSEGIKVRAGLSELNDADLEKKTFEVANIHLHNYDSLKKKRDIAILELKTEIEFKDGLVEPACFATEKIKSKNGADLMIGGWGSQEKSFFYHETQSVIAGELSNSLKVMDVIEKKRGCTNYLICILGTNEDSICTGDGGGPLHMTEKGITKVIGLSSALKGSLVTKHITNLCTGSAVCTRLSFYSSWFQHLTSENYCSGPHA